MTPEERLARIERYCRMMRHSISVPAAEVAADVLALVTEEGPASSTCGTSGHVNGCGCHLEPIAPPVESLNPVSIWEEAAS